MPGLFLVSDKQTDPPYDGDIDRIKADILCARKWALSHFPTTGPDTLLDGPHFGLVFKDDRMEVHPKMYGRVSEVCIEYRLVWAGKRLYWETIHPFSKKVMRLEVPEVKDAEQHSEISA